MMGTRVTPYFYTIFLVLGAFLSLDALGEEATFTNNTPTGSSLETILVGGTIPTSFPDLMTKITSGSAGAKSSATLIPDSRSRQKNDVSFPHPRAVFSANLNPKAKGGGTGLIFISYAETAGELEVISWNPTFDGGKGGYEFQLIKNYGPGLTPEITTPPRSNCIGCHQAEGPIFTSAPWRETTGIIPNGESIEPSGADRPLNKKLLEEHTSGSYAGIPIVPKGVEALILNKDVRQANVFLQARRFCRDACGTDNNCRKNLLLYSLIVSDGASFSIPSKLKSDLDTQTTKNWPADSYGFPASLILDRDPLKGPDEGGSGFRVMQAGVDISFNDELSGIVDLPDFSQTPLKESEKSLADPKTPRPLTNKLKSTEFPTIPAMASCLDFLPPHRDKLRKALNGGSWTLVDQALQSSCVKNLFSKWPPNPDLVLDGVLTYLASSAKKEADPCENFEQKMKTQQGGGTCSNCGTTSQDNSIDESNKGHIEKIGKEVKQHQSFF